VARDAIDLADLVADEEVREVERVRAEVAERAGARRVGVHPPRPRRLGVDQPVLEGTAHELVGSRRVRRLRSAPSYRIAGMNR